MTKHPPGLKTLFITEMWERFSYYGMRAILTLFMLAPLAAGGLGLPTETSGTIYAMYTSLVYLMSIPGGWLADKILGQRKSVLYGGVVIMVGHILLAMHGTATFFAGLGCVVLGTGLLKPNISAIVGQLYDRKDVRREAGFSIFYMGINLGAFLAPIICGFLAQHPWFQRWLAARGLDPNHSWHWGFGAAAVGMFLGLVQYVLTGRNMGDAGLRPAPVAGPDDAAKRKRTLTVGVAGLLAAAAVVIWLFRAHGDWMTPENVDTGYMWLLLTVVVVFFAFLFMAGKWTKGERNRLAVITVLFAGAAVFWGVFEQAGSTLTIFADQSTRNSIFGFDFPSSWWQFLNALLIIILAPFFAWLWTTLGPRNPSYPTKFGIGLVFVGLGFLALVGGAKQWTSIWSDYVAKNKPAIVAAAARYDVKLADAENIPVTVVRKIVANARKEFDGALSRDFEGRNWAGIRATAAKYGVAISQGDVTAADVKSITAAAKDRIESDVLPRWDRVNLLWLFLCYLLHTIGELCLSPVGLAAMTRLAPARVVGLMMGVWFLAASVGNYAGGSVASYYEKFELPTLLAAVAGSAFVMALLMFALVRPIRSMMAVAEAEGAGGAAGH